MADITDVENVVAGIVSNAVYPNGTSSASVANIDINVLTGWPQRDLIDNTVMVGAALVSVFGTKNVRDCTRFERYFIPTIKSAATLTAVVTDNLITIGGTISIPQAINVIFNKIGYGYTILANDTLDTIAAGIAAQIPDATSLGPVVTLNNLIDVSTYIVTAYAAAEELIRVDQIFMIRCWCPTFNVRPIIGQAILQQMLLNYHITLPDGFYGQVWNDHYFDNDDVQKLVLYIRDLYFRIQYPTTITQSFTTIADPFANVTLAQSL